MSLLPSGVVQSPGVSYFATANANSITQVPGVRGIGGLTPATRFLQYQVPYNFKAGGVYFLQASYEVDKLGTINNDTLLFALYGDGDDSGILNTSYPIGTLQGGQSIQIVLSGYYTAVNDTTNLNISVGADTVTTGNIYNVSIPGMTTIYIQQII